MQNVSNYLREDPRHPDNFNIDFLLGQYRRIPLQKICRANGLDFDPSTDTAETLRELLKATDAKIPMPEHFAKFTSEHKAIPEKQEKPKKEASPEPEAILTDEPEAASKPEELPTNYMQLKAMAKRLGMEVTTKTTKDEILEFING